ncbi:acetyltransferase [Phenylobacterium sp.]|jgi:putative acetyltransferase|uniref:acetyltransferase n=1 Tax=Phenylobacterium sp. TaxID=1871053 RepID=UPI0035B0FD18
MIRAMTPDDAPALLALWRGAVEATHHFLTPADIEGLEPEVRGYLASGAEIWVAERDGAAAAFLGLDDAEIATLFVDAAWRGQGVGRALVAFALERGADWVQVNEQNPQAVGFYEAMGFAHAGRSPVDSAGRPFPLLTLKRKA